MNGMDLRKGEPGSSSDTCVMSTLGGNQVTGVEAVRVFSVTEDEDQGSTLPEIKTEPKNAGTSKEQGSSAICKSSGFSLEGRITRYKYTYKKILDLVKPERKINLYGVIHTIVKAPREDDKHAVVRLRDETCGPEKDFRVFIFFSNETAFPKLEQGYILRLHGLKTERLDGELVGRVFSATDVATFPPYGQGIANAFATSESFNFTDSDSERLTVLREWITSKEQQQPLPVDPTLLSAVLSSKPSRTLLSEIKEEGNYILRCKVLDVNILSDEIRIFTVTDGTLFNYCVHLDEDERHATHEVRIMVSVPSPLLKKIKYDVYFRKCGASCARQETGKMESYKGS